MGGEGVALYSRTVGTKGATLVHQEEAIGKALWQQVTTVVILRKNMRQTHNTPEDKKLRKALENMRYKRCTPEDLIFLRSLKSSKSPGYQSITEKQFRNVSIITSFNADKDAINLVGSQCFALETHQTLTDFYSEDLVAPPEDAGDRAKRKAAGNRTRVEKQKVSEKVQKDLWDSPHCSNKKLIPGKLSLCVGLPVMIRQNLATELCITRGQEAYVHSWISVPGSYGQRILDTLFVRLKDAPMSVKVPGLPENVVPLTKSTVATVCYLRNDSPLNVSRTQVEVLPNFAMTEYSSQGKTRDFNVVHIQNCISHQAMYTSLSRGVSARGTITLQGFNSDKITGGASGQLRQEFRELELLDNITCMRFEGKLPEGMHDADRRNTLIDSFRACKGIDYMPPTINPAIRWSKSDPFLSWVLEDVDWSILTKPSKKASLQPKSVYVPARGTNPDSRKQQHSNIEPQGFQDQKRKLRFDNVAPDDLLNDMPNRKRKKLLGDTGLPALNHNHDEESPSGTPWRDNSCAYDATMAVLHNIWRQNPDVMTVLLSNFNTEHLRPLIAGFNEHARSQAISLENVRDDLRYELFSLSGATFPWGRYSSVHEILDRLLSASEQVMSSVRICTRGHVVGPMQSSISSSLVPVLRVNTNTSIQDYVRRFRIQTSSRCRTCRRNLIRVHTFVQAPPLLAFDSASGNLKLVLNLIVPISTREAQLTAEYTLSGIIYHGRYHFTCRVISPLGSVWKHDGLVAGGSMTYEGNITDISLDDLDNRAPIVAVYALQLPNIT
ncbi:hypothetical protein D9615_006088 [Tricholomella constricta]|uniref:DNA helicase n=1 Tax=Tricholomella constricta TaxID=117010 RepID=A0A8H5H8X5_9AGAR|nr:hypothetical protein D9615_006088 [Tricholomella constricta]